MNSPLLWGPNSIANNLQNSILNANGSTLVSDGPKNYITGGGFENNSINSWAAMGLATITNGLPVTVGSGGAAISSSNGGRAKGANTTAPAIVSSGQLSGLYSLNLATSGAGTIGDGYISPAYTIDISDQAKVLNLNFNYKVVTGTPVMAGTSSNTYAAAVYDVVNNAWLPLVGAFNFVQTSGVGKFVGTVQTASNTTSLQVFVYSPVAPVAASALYLDDFFLGPQQVQKGPAMSDWVAYTPTIVGAGASPTSVNAWSRRVGDSLEIRGNFTPGTGTAVTSTFSLGYNGTNGGVTIDGAKFTTGTFLVGHANLATSSTTYFTMDVLATNGDTNLKFGIQNSTANSATAMLGNVTGSNQIAFTAVVPIVGWSSNSVMSADTDTRVVAMQVNQAVPTATITTSLSLLKFTAGVLQDTHGAFSTSTGLYTCPVSGFYRVGTSITVGATYAATNNVSVGIAKNASVVLSTSTFAGGASGNLVGSINTTVYCSAGDTLAPYVASNGTTPVVTSNSTYNWFTVERLSGPAVVAASESVNGRYYNSASTISGTDATITYSTKDRDSHNAYASGTLTIPVSGMYQFNAKLVTGDLSGAHNLQISFYKNGSVWSSNFTLNITASGTGDVLLSDIIPCLAGDLIVVKANDSGTTPTVSNNTSRNYFSWAKVGN